MKRVVAVMASLVMAGCSLVSNRDSLEHPAATSWITNFTCYGMREQFVIAVDTNLFDDFSGELSFVRHPLAVEYFGKCHLYKVRLRNDLLHYSGDFGSLVIRDGEFPLALGKIADAAGYISLIGKPVSSSKQAKEVFDLLLTMFGYEVVTERPSDRADSYSEPRFVEEDMWRLRTVETTSGWEITAMVMVDPENRRIDHLSVLISKEGFVTVIAKEYVYYALVYI